VFLSLALLLLPVTVHAKIADDCNLSWKPYHARGKVKTRTAANGAGYTEFNNGAPITVDQWFQYVCSPNFNNLVPATVDARPSATRRDGTDRQHAQHGNDRNQPLCGHTHLQARCK